MPFRTCIGCKVVCKKEELVRFVVSGNRVLLDKTHSHKGRGAYLHPNAKCIKKGLDKKLISYRFRLGSKGAELDISELEELNV